MNNTSLQTIIIENKILLVRNQKVMIDFDLAALYEVPTKSLNQAVKRNISRFPEHFMFRLNQNEWDNLRSQFVTSNKNISKIRTLPYVFTEQGVAMLSSVLNSEKAIQINIQIMTTFVKIREFALTNKDLSQRLNELEKTFIQYAKDNNENIEEINQALNYLMDITRPAKIGF